MEEKRHTLHLHRENKNTEMKRERGRSSNYMREGKEEGERERKRERGRSSNYMREERRDE